MSRDLFELMLANCQGSNDMELVTMNTKQVASMGPYQICDFAENVKLADTPENMKTLEQGMIRYNDLVHIYEFMFLMVDSGIENFDLKGFEEIIRNSKNPKLMCYCLGFIPGIDFNQMLNALYETKNAKYIERLADEEYEIDVDLLPNYHQKLEEAKAYNYYPECLNQFGTHDIGQLTNQVIETKNPYLINELADYMEYLCDYKGVTGLDISPLQTAQFTYADPLHLYEFAASVKESNKQGFQTAVIESGMPKYMYYMYEYVPGVDKGELKEAIKRTGSTKYIEKVSRTL